MSLTIKSSDIELRGIEKTMNSDKLNKKALGYLGESLASDHLLKAGLKIVMRNYRCTKGELDIIAQDGETLIFVEVRLRTSNFRGTAEESIDRRKIQRIRNIASYYLLEQGYTLWPTIRFDVLAIHWADGDPQINWIRGAF